MATMAMAIILGHAVATKAVTTLSMAVIALPT